MTRNIQNAFSNAADVFTLRSEIVEILVEKLTISEQYENQIEGHDECAEEIIIRLAALLSDQGSGK